MKIQKLILIVIGWCFIHGICSASEPKLIIDVKGIYESIGNSLIANSNRRTFIFNTKSKIKASFNFKAIDAVGNFNSNQYKDFIYLIDKATLFEISKETFKLIRSIQIDNVFYQKNMKLVKNLSYLIKKHNTQPEIRIPEFLSINKVNSFANRNPNDEYIYLTHVSKYQFPFEGLEKFYKDDQERTSYVKTLLSSRQDFSKSLFLTHPIDLNDPLSLNIKYDGFNPLFDLDGDGLKDYIEFSRHSVLFNSLKNRKDFLAFQYIDTSLPLTPPVIYQKEEKTFMIIPQNNENKSIKILDISRLIDNYRNNKKIFNGEYLFSNESFNKYGVNEYKNINFEYSGEVTKIKVLDIDNNGQEEIIFNTKNHGFYYLTISKDLNFELHKGDLEIETPIQQTYAQYDIDRDGIDDAIIKVDGKIGVGLGAKDDKHGYHIYDFVASGEEGLTLKFGDYDNDRRDEIQLSWNTAQAEDLFKGKDDKLKDGNFDPKTKKYELVFEKKEDSTNYTYDPNANSGLLNPQDWYGKTEEEIEIARLEILAKHGYIFKEEKWKSYFKAKDWYKEDPTFSQSRLTQNELRNMQFLKSLQDYKHNAPAVDGGTGVPKPWEKK